MHGFLAALRSELFVARHTLGARLVVLLPISLVLLQYLFTRLGEAGESARDSLLGGNGFDAQLASNAWGYFVDGLTTGLTVLGLLLIAQAAYSFSADRDTGAIRHLVIRRSSRPAIVLAKLTYLHLLALSSVLVLVIGSYLLSAQFWEFGAVVEDGFELIGEAEIREEIRLGLRLALTPLPAAIAFGLLVSVSATTSTQAVVSALGLTLALDILKSMLGTVANYLYVSYQPSLIDQSYLQEVSRLVRGYSDVLIDDRLLQLNTWVPVPAMVLFIAASLVIVNRRSL